MLNNAGWDLWANEYDKAVQLCEEANEYPFAGYKSVLNTIYNQIKAGKGQTILDIGFGTGVLSKRLYDEGAEVYGIDFSQEMIKIAKAKMPNATFYQYDFSKGLPTELQDKKFDYIICTYTIHHLNDAAKVSFIKELKKHLVPGGEILIGDVSFETSQEREMCKENAGEKWDDAEYYIAAKELSKEFSDMEFIKISFCSGVCVIK